MCNNNKQFSNSNRFIILAKCKQSIQCYFIRRNQIIFQFVGVKIDLDKANNFIQSYGEHILIWPWLKHIIFAVNEFEKKKNMVKSIKILSTVVINSLSTVAFYSENAYGLLNINLFFSCESVNSFSKKKTNATKPNWMPIIT